MDGELWIGRKKFQRTVSIVRRQDQSDLWKELTYVVFDSPTLGKGFEARLDFVRECLAEKKSPYARPHEHALCEGLEHLSAELSRLEALGGEGLMLRRAGSRYEGGRSTTLLKVKDFHDLEARVLKHLAGSGRHKGRLGALLVEMSGGTTFSVGTGFSDAERENPPPVGSFITFRYQELSEGGVPRFPSFVGIRSEATNSPDIPREDSKPKKGEETMSDPASGTSRRFEFSDGKSNKFWEISSSGTEVTVRFGRIGTQGQTQTKSFPDEAAAAKHMAKLIEEKLGKGYKEMK